MELIEKYFKEIEDRKPQGLSAKPIESGRLVKELIQEIKSMNSLNRTKALNLIIYNVLPGTTSAALQKALFLQDIILKKLAVKEITDDFAFELFPTLVFVTSTALTLPSRSCRTYTSALQSSSAP